MERIETVDTHEHILPEAERTSQPVDFFTLAGHYVVDDLSSAGLKPADRELLNNKNATATDKWRVFEPAWRYARNTGYSEALRIAVRDIYGVGEITGASITRINDAIRSRNKPGLYQHVLKDRCRVRLAVNDEYWQAQPTAVDSRYFVLARKFDNFVTPITPDGLKRLEALAESSITSLNGLKRAMERQFERALKSIWRRSRLRSPTSAICTSRLQPRPKRLQLSKSWLEAKVSSRIRSAPWRIVLSARYRII